MLWPYVGIPPSWSPAHLLTRSPIHLHTISLSSLTSVAQQSQRIEDDHEGAALVQDNCPAELE